MSTLSVIRSIWVIQMLNHIMMNVLHIPIFSCVMPVADLCFLSPVSSIVFCSVERRIRCLDNHLAGFSVIGKCRYTQGQGDGLQRLSGMGHLKGLNPFSQFLGPCKGRLKRCPRHDQGEFLTAIPAGDITFPYAKADKFANRLKHGIAGIMSICIIKPFEIINIDHDDSDRCSEPSGPGNFLSQ